MAEESAGAQLLRTLSQTHHELAAVLSSGSGDERGATVAGIARSLGLDVLAADNVKDPKFADWVSEQGVDLLLNVHSLFLIRKEIVDAPRIGSFNMHPGPLPEYAGLNAPSWAIYFGERTHAVTLHWMTSGIDTGATAYRATFELTQEDTGLTASAKCVRHGLPLVAQLLDAAERGADAIPALEQDLSRRRYFGADPPQDGRIIWSAPAQRIVDFVRAADYLPFASPWGHPSACLGKRSLGVVKVTRTGSQCDAKPGAVGSVRPEGASVATGDEWILVRRLAIDGRVRNAAEVLEAGQRLSDGG